MARSLFANVQICQLSCGMRLHLALFLFPLAFVSTAQKKEKFFDFRWKETDPAQARYYTVIQKNNSVWLRDDYCIHEKRVQMKGAYRYQALTIPHGQFYYCHPYGTLQFLGVYRSEKKEGTWMHFYEDGSLSDSIPYIHGMLAGDF
jgi:hypothetical protein